MCIRDRVVAHHLPVRRETAEGLLLQHGAISLKIIKDSGAKHHESAVDHRTVAVVLLPEGADLSVSIDIQHAPVSYTHLDVYKRQVFYH